MSADRDLTRIVRSWLHEDAHEDADRVLDLVLDQLDATPQRRPTWLARRFPPMSNGYRYGIAAAVVALAAILGFSLLNRQVGPQPTPTPIPTAEVTPIPTPSFPSLYRSAPSKLAAGAYRHRAFYVPLTLTVPEGWTGLEARPGFVLLVKTRDGEPFGTVPNVALLSVTAINGVFADPCLDAEPISPAPATVDEVVDALTHQVGIQAGPVSTVSLGTHNAKVFDVDNSIDPATCHESANGPLTQWTFLESPGVTSVNSDGTGAHSRMWVLDVDGTLVLISAEFDPASTSQADIAEVYAMADGIRFE
jgi:hypothetical protein